MAVHVMDLRRERKRLLKVREPQQAELERVQAAIMLCRVMSSIDL